MTTQGLEDRLEENPGFLLIDLDTGSKPGMTRRSFRGSSVKRSVQIK